MKQQLILLLMFPAAFAHSQDPPPKPIDLLPKPLEFIVVDTVEASDAKELFARGRRWLVNAFTDTDDVILLNDEQSTTVIGKGWFRYYDKGRIWFTMELVTMQGRYRVRIYDFYHEGVGGRNSGSRHVAYPDYGRILEGDRCYHPQENEMQSIPAEEDMQLNCALIMNLVEKERFSLITGLRKAMFKE